MFARADLAGCAVDALSVCGGVVVLLIGGGGDGRGVGGDGDER